MKHRPTRPAVESPFPRLGRALRAAALASGLLGAGMMPLALTSGCATEPGPAAAADTTKYTLENTDRFVVLDGAGAVTCTGFTEHALADGRMEVVANLKNRDSHPADIQVDCVFKDQPGVTVLEETPWQALNLPGNTTQAVRFTASSGAAKNYTVQVRRGR